MSWIQGLSRRIPIGQSVGHKWHVAINKCSSERGHGDVGFMYEAKSMADEVPRMAYLFSKERAGALAKSMRQCSHSEPVDVPDNHLSCCLGVKCAECPYLLAIDAADLEDEEKDTAKAWTCAAHIVSSGGDMAREGYLLTVDDRMYWDRVYRSLAMDDESEPEATP